MDDINQNPEQKARDNIDKMLIEAGWKVQKKVDFSAGLGIAVENTKQMESVNNSV